MFEEWQSFNWIHKVRVPQNFEQIVIQFQVQIVISVLLNHDGWIENTWYIFFEVMLNIWSPQNNINSAQFKIIYEQRLFKSTFLS